MLYETIVYIESNNTKIIEFINIKLRKLIPNYTRSDFPVQLIKPHLNAEDVLDHLNLPSITSKLDKRNTLIIEIVSAEIVGNKFGDATHIVTSFHNGITNTQSNTKSYHHKKREGGSQISLTFSKYNFDNQTNTLTLHEDFID